MSYEPPNNYLEDFFNYDPNFVDNQSLDGGNLFTYLKYFITFANLELAAKEEKLMIKREKNRKRVAERRKLEKGE